MPSKSSSPAKLSGSRKARRPPSPVAISSEHEDGPDDESEARSIGVTPDPETPTPAWATGDVDSPDIDVDQLVEVTKSVGKKRPAPKDDSDSEIEITNYAAGKKAKTGHIRQESSRVLAALDESQGIEKRIRKPTEKAKAADVANKTTAKRAPMEVKKASLAVSDGDPGATVESPKLQRVIKPSSKAPVSDTVEEPERPQLMKCVMVPFSSNANASGDERMMDLKSLLGTLPSKNDRRLLAAALEFKSCAPFINPSLASPDLVVVDKDHLVWEDSRANAVFFTTGCVSACNLIIPAPGINNSAAAKKLLLFPIDGIFQQGLDFFGFKFKATQVAGQISNGVVTYSTKKEGQAIFASSGITGSPKKKGLFRKPASGTAAPLGGNFPLALSFGENVPIYDATRGSFSFVESDLTNVKSLPLYRKGSYDLPPYAVVTVAYTVTSFITSNSPSANTALLFNVLFAVLLAEKINDEGDMEN